MKTNVFSEELLPACSVNNRTDLHSGSVFISSINALMFIVAAIIREGRRFMPVQKKMEFATSFQSCVTSPDTCSVCDSHGKVALEQRPGVCQGRACCCAFLELMQWPPSCRWRATCLLLRSLLKIIFALLSHPDASRTCTHCQFLLLALLLVPVTFFSCNEHRFNQQWSELCRSLVDEMLSSVQAVGAEFAQHLPVFTLKTTTSI